jgi:hypothetical protein
MSKVRIALVIVGGVIVLGGMVTNLLAGTGDIERRPDEAPTSSLVYRVDGNSNQADITFVNLFGFPVTNSGEPLPWEVSFAVAKGGFVHVSAQRGGGSGDITCTIELDGQVIETNTSTGAFSTCVASGTV